MILLFFFFFWLVSAAMKVRHSYHSLASVVTLAVEGLVQSGYSYPCPFKIYPSSVFLPYCCTASLLSILLFF